MVGSILHIVFGHEDQRVRRIAAVRHRLHELTEREIAVGLLRFRRVDAAERGAEAAHVVVADANQRQARKLPLATYWSNSRLHSL
jgi:hypothetical protein